MSPRWYFARNGQTFGPFSHEQLRDLARDGRLLPNDMVAYEGANQWVPASTVQGLFAPAAPPPAAAFTPAAPAPPVAQPARPKQVVGVAAAPQRAAAPRAAPAPAAA